MQKGGTDQPPRSDPHHEYDEMLAAALARPGVREAMKVFQNWQRKDQEQDAYRATVNRIERATTTNHANVV